MVCIDLNFCLIKDANSVQGVLLSTPGILTAGLSHTGPLATGLSLLGLSD